MKLATLIFAALALAGCANAPKSTVVVNLPLAQTKAQCAPMTKEPGAIACTASFDDWALVLLPEGLTDSQYITLLDHEMCHVAGRSDCHRGYE